MTATGTSADERHMSDHEALMWNLEKDPLLRSDFGNVTILDRPADLERLRVRLDRVAGAFPRLRRRVQPTFGRLAPPRWEDDPSFDVDYHVRRVGLPGSGDGSERDLLDLASAVLEDPFDRTRPLWRFWVVDGLSGGRGAIVQQMHHSITDGEGGVRMSAWMLDLERDASEPMVPIPEPADADSEAGPSLADLRGPFAGARDAAVHNLRRQIGIGRRSAEAVGQLVRHPGDVVGAVGGARSSLDELLGQLRAEPAHSPLWTERSLSRHLETTRLRLDDAKRAAKALGGTINDLFVAGAVAAAGDYHRRLGQPVDELRISMPISTRSKGAEGGNAFAPTTVVLPAGPMGPSERFAAVHDALHRTKESQASSGLDLAALSGVVNLLPTSLLVSVARATVGTVDFGVSNVRGAPFDLYLGGGHIDANYPVGPTAGTAFNLTLLSSGGFLDMGLNCDRAAISDPGLLRECLELSYDELVSAC